MLDQIQQSWLGNYKIYELKHQHTNSWLKVAPERGGIVVGLGLRGEELLYLNEESFRDPKANVRGGIPILFPICGQLEKGQYEWDGNTYAMRNHGFARTMSWDVTKISLEGNVSITLTLRSNEESKRSYPFDFELRFTYTLDVEGLTIDQQYANLSDVPMPMYAGFHPYFRATNKLVALQTDASAYLDYNDLETKPIRSPLDLSCKESLVLLGAKQNRVTFVQEDIGRDVTITYDAPFRYIVLWSEAEKPFICVEPWMAMTNAFNETKEALVHVGPGETLTTRIRISSGAI